MINFFTDWKKVTGTFQQMTATKNAAGQPVETWATVTSGGNLELNFWIDSAIESNTNDKFVGKQTGKILLKYGIITPSLSMRVLISSKYYYITGIDNVGGFNDFYVLSWVLTDG